MMQEALTVLAASGGSAVVAAMATDAWQTARARVVRLFRHDGEALQGSIESQLDGNVELVGRAEAAEPARQALLPLWQLHMAEFLRRHPDAADELRSLITDVTAALPVAEQHWVQRNEVSGSGSLFAAQGGNVIVHQTPNHPPNHLPAPPAPGPPTGADRDGDR